MDGHVTRRPSFETIRYEVDADHVATITLDRPEVLNAFDRQMCEEMRDAWRRVKDDPERQRRRAAGRGRPGVLRRARHQQALRPARRRLEPRGPRRAAQPEVAEGVEAGGLRGAGHLHRRRLLLPQRGRHRHLLDGRHLLRLARHLRDGVGARAGRPDAPGRPRRDAAHRADGQRRAGHRRRPRCASASSPRSSSGRSSGTAPTRSPPASPPSRPPPRRARSAPSGSRSTGPTAPRWSRASSTPASATRSAWPRSPIDQRRRPRIR